MKQKILVISGRKQAGKNTLANFLQGVVLLQHNLIDEFEVSERTSGELVTIRECPNFDEDGRTFEEYETNCNEHIRKYEYAGELENIMRTFFGITDAQLNGPNGEKDTLTKYRWENMPGLPQTEFANKEGYMTARQITQYVGTEVFRRIYDQIHIEATYNKIKDDKAKISTINGARFANEVLYRPDFPAEIKTIRLARVMHPEDTHSSEASLDPDKFNWNNFDAVIWNQHLSIEETCKAALAWFRVWGWVK